MNSGRRAYVKRKLSAKDWHSSETKRTIIMEGRSSFSNLHHHHRHHPSSFPLTLSGFQSPDAGYQPSHSAQDSQDQYGGRGEESAGPFLASNTSAGVRRGSSGSDGVFITNRGGSLDGDAGLGGHFGGDGRLGGHFDDSWYGKKGMWDDGESGESAADDFHSKADCYSNTSDVFCSMSCAPDEADRWRIRSNCNSYGQGEAVCSREGGASHFGKQAATYGRTDSKASDHHAGGEEDYGSSCGSAEDQLQQADADGSWLTVSPTGETEVRGQAEGRWRGADGLASGSPLDINGRAYTQKLDSFSEAFLPQRRRLVIPPDRESAHIWENGIGRGDNSGSVKVRQSCAFDPDAYLHPSSSSLSSSFPSPPTSSHLMPSVLSPPPTPLPPPSQSPSKADSPSAQGGAGHAASQGGESLGGLQFFPSRFQSSGMILKHPMLSHCLPQLSADPSDSECSLRSSQATCDILQSPDPSSLTSPTHRSSHHSSRALCPSGSPSSNASFPLPFHPFPGKHHETTEKISAYKTTQKIKSEPVSLDQQHPQEQAAPVYTGRPFPSILHSKRAQNRGRYTPRPLLNPSRRGTGLFSSLLSVHRGAEETARAKEEERCGIPYVNVGPGFQADLPPCVADAGRLSAWISEEDSPREQLLWKPWDELQESAHVHGQVEKLLSMCSSSCLPGGGSNTELALHCLHYCKGNTMVTLEMLLFSQPSPAGDYHYSGCDLWTDTEKNLFGVALATYGKDFPLIEKMVRTKTVSQCVEFYYLSKKLADMQKKQKEEEVREAMELQKCLTPISQPLERPFALEEAAPVPSLASFFPCKLCGKMFYKIKSRNAHMKIHRQPQEDWTDRRLQHQLLTQRLALARPANLIPSPRSSLLPPQASSAMAFSSSGLASSSNGNPDGVHNIITNNNTIAPNQLLDPCTGVTFSNITPTNSHLIAMNSIDGCDANRKDPTLPFLQPWSSFGHLPDLASFYCIAEGKEEVGAGAVEGKEAISWQ
ncbi:transcriptional-regulating factor 1 isoform X1 [Fundulus heteroclitus]|uniref:transcriptional-regulating factor 1 isoform X1 n=2 Tax=Fundulus heteroclitus TaxID=8078 RepID=UPI00165B003F|nr:transcriptional-regulating factor 1 isoform X1 [Fundulus heteroclitus]